MPATRRASRFTRDATAQTLGFTKRDRILLYALYRYPLLTTHQLATLHPGSAQKTRWRLRELFDAGYVHRYNTKTDLTIPGSEPIVYALTDRGATWLSAHCPDIERLKVRYNENNARRTLASIPHGLMVADLLLRFELACTYQPEAAAFLAQAALLARLPEARRRRRTPTQWNCLVAHQGQTLTVGNHPDQVFGLINRARPEGRNTLYFFLEADRGTETVQPVSGHLGKATLYRKLLAYYHTHLRKAHQAAFGDWMRNFRVLFVVDSAGRGRGGQTRLENLLETARAATDNHLPDLFLFTTYDAFKASENPLTHSWVNAQGEPRLLL